ncbi:MAG: aminopeptidase [Chloroflexi bacterium]|nr:aminopeptidase [Chloroflexota bacterium]
MSDPRITKLAQVLVHYSVEIKPGDQFLITASPLAQELTLAVYEEAVKTGAYPMILTQTPGTQEIFFQHANDEQLTHISPVERMIVETFDATLNIGAPYNTRSLSGVNPERQALAGKSRAEISKIFMERVAKRELKWCYTVFPTHASAQEADMSLREYADFVYGAGLLDSDDPVAGWTAVSKQQQELIDWLADKDQVVIKGANIDMQMSIKKRPFINACGKENFPDGEIFTSPIEDSVNGWVRFGYPAIYGGREVEDIELWFEDGKVVKEKANKGQELLTALLNTDDGSRILGELGIGTNYGIQRFTKNMLFDEKIGGTIHLAVGAGFPESGSKNVSGLHWDMLCDMAEGEITMDGELFYKDGKFAVNDIS